MKKNSVKEVLWFKLIQPAKNKNGELLNFYAVPSSKYGIRIPKGATNWCLAVLGGEKAEVLLIEPFLKDIDYKQKTMQMQLPEGILEVNLKGSN